MSSISQMLQEKKKEEERARRFGEKLEEAKQGMEHLVNSIPGGIMIYRIAKERLIPEFYSDGVIEISGHTREEFSQLIQNDVFDIVYERDRDRVVSETQEAVKNGTLLMISYRMYHKDGSLIWVHVNGRRMGTFSEEIKFYAVITGISEETKLYQDIANESARWHLCNWP